MSNIEAALAVAEAGLTDAAPAPDTSTDAPAPEQPAAPTHTPNEPTSVPPTEPAAAPTVDRVTLDKLRERQAAKQQPQQRQAPADPEFAEYQAWKTAREATRSPGLDPKALQTNPIAALEAAGLDPTALLNTLTKHMVTPDAAVLESKIDAKLRAAEERAARAEAAVEQIRSERQQNAQARGYTQARQQFIDGTSAADKFPLLAKLEPELRAEYGSRKARELQEEQIEASLEEIAHLVEQDLSKLSGLLGRDQQAPTGATPTPSQQATNGSAPRRAATITSDAASSTSANRRLPTEKERLAAAMELARRG